MARQTEEYELVCGCGQTIEQKPSWFDAPGTGHKELGVQCPSCHQVIFIQWRGVPVVKLNEKAKKEAA